VNGCSHVLEGQHLKEKYDCKNMNTSHFWALYFTGIYYTAIGNTKVSHREHREHVWRTLSHIANYGSDIFKILGNQRKIRAFQKNMDKP